MKTVLRWINGLTRYKNIRHGYSMHSLQGKFERGVFNNIIIRADKNSLAKMGLNFEVDEKHGGRKETGFI